MARRYVRRLSLVLSGVGVGLVLLAVVSFIYFRTVTEYRELEPLLRGVNLPAEALELEALEGDSIARIILYDVALRGEGGDTIAVAPVARLRLYLPSLGTDEPVLITQAVLVDPYVNLVQYPNGELNLARVAAVTAGGREVAVDEEQSAGFIIRDLRIEDGRVRLATPWVPDSLPIPAEQRAQIRLAREGGTTMRVRTIRDLDARLPLVRFGTADGWRVEVADLNARLTDPDLRVLALEGFAEEEGERIRFGVDVLRTGNSLLEAAGTVALGGETPQFDVVATARPLDFGDLQWIVPALPAGGQVAGTFALESRPGGRTAVSARDLVATAWDSRVEGRFSALVGGDDPAEFWDTRLTLAPLTLETVERLGVREEIPYDGEITGTIASLGGDDGAAEGLGLNLVLNARPQGLDVPTSTVFLEGPVSLGGADAMVRFAGLRVGLQPLHLAALRPLFPEQQDRLRGVLRGDVVLTGTPTDLRVRDGVLAYQVGGAPETQLTGISLALSTDPQLRFDLEARADPLALATLSELFPAFPFRTARFAGPIRIAGTADRFEVDADLSGAPGGITIRGSIAPGEPLAFDLSGRLEAFNTEAVLTRPTPVDGPVSGTYRVAGTAEDFRFNVALAQDTGSFALQGRVRLPTGGAPQFEVAGDVQNFNLGALIGRPRLFPSRLSGRVELTGGGQSPYRFDVDLRGPAGVLDVAGYYAGGATPTYRVDGMIRGLNLQQLPLPFAVPETSLNGTIALQGSGTTPQTLSGTLRLDAAGSLVAGVPVETLRANVAVRDGVLVVDTLVAAYAGSSLTASGTWGLTRPAANPLFFRVVSRDLRTLGPLLAEAPGLEPRIAGSFLLQGSVAGSLERPVVDATFRGQRLRYEGWGAERLAFDVDAVLGVGTGEVQGELSLSGDRVLLAGQTTLDSLRLTLQGGQERVAVRMAASRDGETDISVNGVMELEGRAPRGLVLDSLALRVGDMAWRLAGPSAIRWGGVDGVLVNNLVLRRVGDEGGLIRVDGTVPPTGEASLRVGVRNLDLAMVEQLLPNGPPLGGIVSLDAVLEGPVTDPELTLEGRASRFAYRGVMADSLILSARYDERRLVGNGSIWSGGLLAATVDATVPMLLQVGGGIPSFDVLETEPLRVRLAADSVPLGLLAAPFPQVENGAGVVAAQVLVRGTVDRPTLDGWATVRNGALTVLPLGVRYQRIAGRVVLQDQVARIDTLTLWNEGPAVLNGTIRFADLDRPEVYLTATMEEFRAMDDRDLAEIIVSGNVALSGRLPDPVLTGRVVAERGTIFIPTFEEQIPLDITALDVGEIGADTVSAAQATGAGLAGTIRIEDLNVVVNEGVWVESEDARVEIRGELRVFRNSATELPQIYGTLQAVRGTYALTIGPLVREFQVVSGSVRFFGTGDLNPELDLTAAHEVRVLGGTASPASLTVLVRVTGTLDYPRIQLTSDTRPPLPESELLNYLIFGRPTFQLAGAQGGLQGGLVEQVLVQELLGGLLIQQLGNLGLPCETFRLRGRPEVLNATSLAETSVECGVQIFRNVFLTFEAGLGTFSNSPLAGMSLEWQINDHLQARIAREPIRTGLRFRTLGREVPYQWSTELRGTWEFGRPRHDALPEPDPTQPRLPGEVAPAPPVPAPQGEERRDPPPARPESGGSAEPRREEPSR